MERDELSRYLSDGLSVEEIGRRVGKHPSTVSYWLAKYGLRSSHADKHVPRGGVDRDELAALVEAGLTTRQIAAQLGRSQATVRHWLTRYGLRTRAAERRERPHTDAARRWDECPVHGPCEFVAGGDGYYRCKRCRAGSVARRRRRVKEVLVAEAGGCCQICGYSRYLGALEFHHLDPAEKRLGLANRGLARSIAVLRAEAAKCVLLCSNCHAEVEAGIAQVPIK